MRRFNRLALAGTVNAATDFIELTGGTFGSISTVATELESGAYALKFSGTLGGMTPRTCSSLGKTSLAKRTSRIWQSPILVF